MINRVFLILLITFGSVISLQCQNNTFAPIGAKWYYGIQLSQSAPDKDYRTLEVIKDTLIDGKQCSVLEQTEHYKNGDAEYISGYKYLFYDQQKVYRWDKEKEGFSLLYDLSANVGDSWTVPCLSCGNPASDSFITIHVNSVKYIQLSGKYLKQLTVSVDGLYSFGETITERIGGNGYLFLFDYGADDTFIPNLRCYSDGEITGSFSGEACDAIVSEVTNPTENKLSIIVAKDYVIIPESILSNTDKVRFYDVTGKCILAVAPDKNGKISISTLSKGVYILAIHTISNEVKIFKMSTK